MLDKSYGLSWEWQTTYPIGPMGSDLRLLPKLTNWNQSLAGQSSKQGLKGQWVCQINTKTDEQENKSNISSIDQQSIKPHFARRLLRKSGRLRTAHSPHSKHIVVLQLFQQWLAHVIHKAFRTTYDHHQVFLSSALVPRRPAGIKCHLSSNCRHMQAQFSNKNRLSMIEPKHRLVEEKCLQWLLSWVCHNCRQCLHELSKRVTERSLQRIHYGKIWKRMKNIHFAFAFSFQSSSPPSRCEVCRFNSRAVSPVARCVTVQCGARPISDSGLNQVVSSLGWVWSVKDVRWQWWIVVPAFAMEKLNKSWSLHRSSTWPRYLSSMLRMAWMMENSFSTSVLAFGLEKLERHSSRHWRKSDNTGVMPEPPAKASGLKPLSIKIY